MRYIRFRGRSCIEVGTSRGDRVVVSCQGAQVLSWRTTDGVEQLYMSPGAVFDGRTAIRGGVPICFPQFGNEGALQKHGFARNLEWQAEACTDGVALYLRDDDATRRLWNHSFGLAYRVLLAADRLTLELEVRNTGSHPFEFSAALHTYFRLGSGTGGRLKGLDCQPYEDCISGLAGFQVAAPIELSGDLDRIFPRPPAAMTLLDGDRAVRITQSPTFTDVVLWHPAPHRCAQIPDLPPDGCPDMACIEAARVRRAAPLPPGSRWRACQQLTRL